VSYGNSQGKEERRTEVALSLGSIREETSCSLAYTTQHENAGPVLLGLVSSSTVSRPEPVFVSSVQQRGAGPNYVGVDTGPSG